MSTPTLLNNLLKRLRTRRFGAEKYHRSKPKEGKSMRSIAETLEISPSYLARMESGELEKPTREVLLRLIDVYELGPAWGRVLETIYKMAKEGVLPADSEADDDEEPWLNLQEFPPGQIRAVCGGEMELREGLEGSSVLISTPAVVSLVMAHYSARSLDDLVSWLELVKPRMISSRQSKTLCGGTTLACCIDESLLVYNFDGKSVYTAEERELGGWLRRHTRACEEADSWEDYQAWAMNLIDRVAYLLPRRQNLPIKPAKMPDVEPPDGPRPEPSIFPVK